MILRWAKEHDLAEVQAWWPEHDVQPPPLHLLSNMAVAENKGRLVAAVSLGLEVNGVVAFIAYVASNKDAGIKERSAALDALIDSLEQYAAKRDYKTMWCFTPTPAIGKRLMKHDYLTGDTSVTHYLKGL